MLDNAQAHVVDALVALEVVALHVHHVEILAQALVKIILVKQIAVDAQITVPLLAEITAQVLQLHNGGIIWLN